jgi:hypothetical protein
MGAVPLEASGWEKMTMKLMSGLVALAAAAGLVLAATSAPAVAGGGTILAVTRFDDPSPDGCAPTDCSLREAVIAANEQAGADTIELAAGTYILTIEGRGEDAAATGDLDVTDDLTLLGTGQDETVIDAGRIDRVLQAGNLAGSQIRLEIRDLTLSHGLAVLAQGLDSGSGGGLFVRHSVVVTATRVIVRDNIAGVRGGGVYVLSGGFGSQSVTVIDSKIIRNQAGTPKSGVGGGGLYNEGRTTILLGTEVAENTAGFLGGGGIDNASGSLTVRESVVRDNTAGHAGGIANGGLLTIEDSVLSGNQGAISGGGLDAGGMGVIITRSLITGNITNQEGGGINFSGDPSVVLSITDSTISGNSADQEGGGLFSWVGGTVEMSNVTVSGNSAGISGGGLYIQSGDASLTNVTVSDNSSPAGATGSGIFNQAAAVSLVNTIVADGSGGENCAGAITSLGHNLDDGASCGFSAPGDLSNVGAMLGPLADNGGPAMTHALLPGSPAIDAGDDASCPAADQRGVARPFDGDGDALAVCDIGAYEADIAVLLGDVDCDGSVTAIDAALILQLVAALVGGLECPQGDVNRDGNTTAVDAALVLQLVAGLIPHF